MPERNVRKEKRVMASFFAANVADVGITLAGLNMGMKEILPLKPLVEGGEFQNAVLIKMALVSIYIGLYALTRGRKNSADFILDKTMMAMNLITWGVVALNTAQVAAQILIH
jgi:hypothetical protein